MHWCQHTWFGLQLQPGWDPGKSLFVSPRLFTSCSGKSSYEGAFLRLLRFCHAMSCQATSYETAIQDLYKFWSPSKFLFLQGLSPHPAHALMLMWLPSFHSTGSDILGHTWVPFSPSMGTDSPTGWPWPTTHAQPYLIVFRLKLLSVKGEWKEGVKTRCFRFEHEGSLLLLSHPKPQRRGCLF